MNDEILAWHVLSYPRSGNHLVRTLLEFASHRPTMGVIESTKDDPIFSRPPNQALNLINIKNFKPIGYKSHWLNQVRLVERTISEPKGLIFIQRKMENAIFSHLYRSLRKKLFVSNRLIQTSVRDAVNQYLSVVYFYESYNAGPKIKILFEDLAKSNTEEAMEASRRFLKELGLELGEISENTFKLLMSMSKESQSSNKEKRNAVLERRIREEILRYA